MALFLKECKYRLPFLLVSIAAFEGAWYIDESYNRMELNYFLIPITLCGLLFTNQEEIEMIQATKTEIELCVVSGTKAWKLLACKYASVFIYTYIPAAFFSLLFLDPALIPRILTSYFVTLLFITSFSLIFRMIINNTYAGVVFSAFIFYAFTSQTSAIYTRALPLQRAYFDPYITYYAFETRFLSQGEIWQVDMSLWIVNRLMFLGLAIAFLIISSYLAGKTRIYSREK